MRRELLLLPARRRRGLLLALALAALQLLALPLPPPLLPLLLLLLLTLLPPQLTTRIWHPSFTDNDDPAESGLPCLHLLKDGWSPAVKVPKVSRCCCCCRGRSCCWCSCWCPSSCWSSCWSCWLR